MCIGGGHDEFGRYLIIKPPKLIITLPKNSIVEVPKHHF